MHTHGEPSLVLSYQSPGSARRIGNSQIVRVVAAVTSLVLLGLVVHFMRRSRETLGGLSDWISAIGASVAGSMYCALISLNLAGRTISGSISWLRRTGGLGAPVILIATAAGWIQEVLVDPYARTRDVVLWILVAIATGVVAVLIGYLNYVHWNDTNEGDGLAVEY